MRTAWLVLMAYAVWFGASLLAQHHTPRLQRLVQRLDPLRLCPSWTLFRSPPLDAALVWRDQLKDGTCTAWRTVSTVVPSTWLGLFWRPQAYQPQLLHTYVVAAIAAVQTASAGPAVESSFSHRAVWHYLARFPPAPGAVARQFQLLVSDDGGSTPPGVVYCSPLLPLPGDLCQRPGVTV